MPRHTTTGKMRARLGALGCDRLLAESVEQNQSATMPTKTATTICSATKTVVGVGHFLDGNDSDEGVVSEHVSKRRKRK